VHALTFSSSGCLPSNTSICAPQQQQMHTHSSIRASPLFVPLQEAVKEESEEEDMGFSLFD